MSIRKIFAVRDVKADAFGNPFVAQHVGIAVRSLTDAVNDPNLATDIARHPADFVMYELGTFDESSGQIVPVEIPTQVATAISLKNPVLN